MKIKTKFVIYLFIKNIQKKKNQKIKKINNNNNLNTEEIKTNRKHN